LDKRGYRLSFAAADIDAVAAHAFLTRAYWCEGIPLALVERAIANSLCIALHAEGAGQVGFARAVTDRTTFAYLCDVYVLEDHRGGGWPIGWFNRCSLTRTCKACAASCCSRETPSRSTPATASSRWRRRSAAWRSCGRVST